MRATWTPDEEVLALWYELGGLYSSATGSGQRALKLGLTAVCLAAALVLLSAPLFGTAWAGPFAPGIPVAVGVLSGGGLYLAERSRVSRRGAVLRRELAERGADPRRPTRDGLAAYYDAQLVLLRSEYEFLRLRGAKAAQLFEEVFGFAPEDPFETGPLNVAPDTEDMRELRRSWESRLAEKSKRREPERPELGLEEDVRYRVFPREMTVPVELATREAYLAISRRLMIERYGRAMTQRSENVPRALRRRVERDLGEYAALTRRSGSRSRP